MHHTSPRKDGGTVLPCFTCFLYALLQDYLAAPMPYLVGLNSDCLPMLRSMALEEVRCVRSWWAGCWLG